MFFQANSVKSLDGSGASSMFGSIDTKCEIAPIIESAYKVFSHFLKYFFMKFKKKSLHDVEKTRAKFMFSLAYV